MRIAIQLGLIVLLLVTGGVYVYARMGSESPKAAANAGNSMTCPSAVCTTDLEIPPLPAATQPAGTQPSAQE